MDLMQFAGLQISRPQWRLGERRVSENESYGRTALPSAFSVSPLRSTIRP